MNKVSTLWINFTNDIASVTKPAVAWETIAKEVVQLTPETTVEDETTPATYRTWVYPVDLNDDGAAERDIAIGYGFMSFLGDVFSIIAIGEDGSIDIQDDQLCGYCPPCGRPAMIYSSSSPVKPPTPKPVISTRWIEINLACTLDGSGHNTGIQTGISKKQIFNKITNAWEDTGEQTDISRTNLSACPLYVAPVPPKRAYKYSGKPSFVAGSSEIIPYAENSLYKITNQLAAGTNRQFISIPTGKYLHVKDKSTSFEYTIVGTDNREGYFNNTVWMSPNMFLTVNPTSFYIEINDSQY